jgi:hypothetical protein
VALSSGVEQKSKAWRSYSSGAMKGIEHVLDERAERRAVLIDLDLHGDLWEDFYDIAVAMEREGDPRESLAEVEAKLSSGA